MPITASAKKALRQSARRRMRNLGVKKSLKTAVKKFRQEAAKNKDAAAATLSLVYQELDKAAKKNVIKRNTASRLKSRLTRLLKK